MASGTVTQELSLRLDSIIQSFGLDDEVRAEVREWGRVELEVASQFVHVSYISAVMESLSHHVDKQGPGMAILGSPTTFSERTLEVAASMIWIFSRIAFPLLVSRQPMNSVHIHRLNRNDENDQTLVLAYEVYHELVQNHWSNNTIPALEERGEATSPLHPADALRPCAGARRSSGSAEVACRRSLGYHAAMGGALAGCPRSLHLRRLGIPWWPVGICAENQILRSPEWKTPPPPLSGLLHR